MEMALIRIHINRSKLSSRDIPFTNAIDTQTPLSWTIVFKIDIESPMYVYAYVLYGDDTDKNLY